MVDVEKEKGRNMENGNMTLSEAEITQPAIEGIITPSYYREFKQKRREKIMMMSSVEG